MKNERIDELMIVANNQTGNEFDLNHKPLNAFLEKFAELIVRDCLKQIYGRTLVGTADKKWSDEETGYNRGVDAAYKKVKEHFGIK